MVWSVQNDRADPRRNCHEYDGKIKIGKVNIDEQQYLARQYGIRAIPTFLLFNNGEVADQIVGPRSNAISKPIWTVSWLEFCSG